MSDVNVLIVFYSRGGTAEQLGLAAGVGAIQARANIRLRRVADVTEPQAAAASAGWIDQLERMNRDYVAPRPADPAWADVIVMATPGSSSAEVEAFCAVLRSQGGMDGKIAAPLAAGNRDSVLRPIYSAAACAGLIVAPPPDAADPLAAAREFGRRVTAMARVLKQSVSGQALAASRPSPPL